jgi:hypothetical protein
MRYSKLDISRLTHRRVQLPLRISWRGVSPKRRTFWALLCGRLSISRSSRFSTLVFSPARKKLRKNDLPFDRNSSSAVCRSRYLQ